MTAPRLNPYLDQIQQTLPRLLGLFDTDVTSPSYGWGDRFHWSWKLIDFGNATFQGAAHGLARLLTANLLPSFLTPVSIERRIWAMFDGARKLVRSDGSLEEAFPHEHSFCVTALIAFDLLSALECLGKERCGAKFEEGLSTVRPMISFLMKADETHAFISNHLATAVAALTKWGLLTRELDKETRGRLFLDRILAKQSVEGWFLEYDGFDPGYQTLCLSYLADVHRMKPDWGLSEPLRRALAHLVFFAHPDGSFGGLYGSRNTRFFIPGGLEMLARDFPEASGLCSHMRLSIADQRCVTLLGLDAPNLVPVFNSYCWAASTVAVHNPESVENPVPSLLSEVWRKRFDQAGLVVDKTEKHYTVISWHKGGVVYSYDYEKRIGVWNAGHVVQDAAGQRYSTQMYDASNRCEIVDDGVTIEASLTGLRKQLPKPWQFWILRLLNMTFMRVHFMAEMVKKFLVYLLITGKKKSPYRNLRRISLGHFVKIEDLVEPPTPSLKTIEHGGIFYGIHMASQGYWQKQDDQQ